MRKSILNSVLIFGIVTTLHHGSLADSRDYVGKEFEVQITSNCSNCPKSLRVTKETIEHSLQHYLGEIEESPKSPIELRENSALQKLARASSSTTVLNEVNGLELVLSALFQSAPVSGSLDKKAMTLIESDSDTIAYRVNLQISEGVEKSQFIVAFCRKELCKDEHQPGVEINFRDIISIYPVCGPSVIELAKRKTEKGPVKMRIKRCPLEGR